MLIQRKSLPDRSGSDSGYKSLESSFSTFLAFGESIKYHRDAFYRNSETILFTLQVQGVTSMLVTDVGDQMCW